MLMRFQNELLPDIEGAPCCIPCPAYLLALSGSPLAHSTGKTLCPCSVCCMNVEYMHSIPDIVVACTLRYCLVPVLVPMDEALCS